MVDRTRFAALVAARRKEKGLTQRQLAEQLHVSDKAVSKWERALSLPDIELLDPLAQALDLTVTELLRGERLPAGTALPLGEVENLVSDTLALRQGEQAQRESAARRRYLVRWGIAVLPVLAEIAAASLLQGISIRQYLEGIFSGGPMLAVSMGLAFALAVGLGWPERLPDYYDEYKVHGYSNGFVQLNLPGVCLNNRNWPAVKAAAFWGCLGVAVALPLLDLAVWLLAPPDFYWAAWRFSCTFLLLAGIFLPMILAARLADRNP